ncbi:MAG: toxin-antitoxin system TumE family protein [Stellaceae bacterium]
MLRERRILGEGRFADIVIWQLPSPVPGSTHGFKYRLAFVVEGVCVLRFDNETGNGDHKNIGTEEVHYTFTSLVQLVTDFWNAIDEWSSP